MLESSTHRLRAIEPTDVPQLLAWENDASAWWLGASIAPYSEALMLKYATGDHDLYRDRQLRHMLDLKSSQGWLTVGAIDLYDLDPRNQRAGVGVVVNRELRRQGHAKEGLSLLREYAFSHLGLHQLYAEVPADHSASVELFKNCGYEVSEKRSEWVRKNDEWLDVFLMQLIA